MSTTTMAGWTDAALPTAGRGTVVLAVGFGSTVAMWAVGYVARLPALLLPSPIVLGLLLACLAAGGVVLGRYAGLGWRHGVLAGLVSGSLNLLVLGSFLVESAPGRIVPSVLWWVPGSLLLAMALVAGGAVAGRRWPRPGALAGHGTAALVWVAVAAALLLLGVGGLVTSTGSGLAVTDWPNSFGYNMFLYPFSRMTGGIYYEHAHRLFGALVGLTTLVLAATLQRVDSRRWVRVLGWIAVGLVVVQGVLGGLRVTGHFTLSASAEHTRPNLLLAAVHGALGQLFFAVLVGLAVVSSPGWRTAGPPARRGSASTDRTLSVALVVLLLGQLVLGVVQRHFDRLLLAHVVVGVALVAPLALHVGLRSWGLNPDRPRLRRLGLCLVAAVAGQLALGLAALVAAGGPAGPAVEIAVTTAHQWFGAVLLAVAVALGFWTFRSLDGAPAGAAGPPR